MTKNLFFSWLLVLPLLLLYSCSSNNSDSNDKKKTTPQDIVEPDVAETTLFIYMPYTGPSNDLTDALQSNLTAIRQAIKNNKGMGTDKVIAFISEGQDTSRLIQYHYSILKKETVSDTLKTYANRDLDFTSSKLIESLFTQVKSQAPAKEYAMIIGSHALGWLPKNSISNLNVRVIGGNSSIYQMDNKDLANGIMAGVGTLKFLVMDNCQMANVETAYDLRSCTHKLIASVSSILGAGLPYQTMFKYLLGTPDYEKALDAYDTFYENYTYPYGTLSLIDCDQVESFANVMKQVNAETSTLSSAELAEVQRYDIYRNGVFFDLGDYITKLCKDNSTLLNQANQALALLVPYAVNTPNYAEVVSSWGASTIKACPINSYSGITCSDPSVNGAIEAVKEKTEWWIATH